MNNSLHPGLILTLLAALSFPAAAQLVPPQLQPPAGEQLFLTVHAKGDQVYSCKADGSQFTWVLKAPDADLFDTAGNLFGKHFRWTFLDGQ